MRHVRGVLLLVCLSDCVFARQHDTKICLMEAMDIAQPKGILITSLHVTPRINSVLSRYVSNSFSSKDVFTLGRF